MRVRMAFIRITDGEMLRWGEERPWVRGERTMVERTWVRVE